MKGTVEIKNGIYDLLVSGSIIVSANDATELFLLSQNDAQPLKFVFKFENEEKDSKQPRKIAKVIDKTSLEIIFTNYNNSLGSYSKELWYVGTISNRKLYFTYVIYGLVESKTKKIDYSFYLGEEIQNG